jgi:hypothetical protein
MPGRMGTEMDQSALDRGGSQNNVPCPTGGLGIGRYFRPDELEMIPEPP